jgi:ribosome-associated protein
MQIELGPGISVPEEDLSERFVRSSGPGGQNVNKLSTAVELRFRLRQTTILHEAAKTRLARLAGRRLTLEGEVVIFADRFRTQERNRADARERLADLIREARISPKIRRATRPTLGSKQRRLEGKSRRGEIKRMRGTRPDAD